MIEALAWTGFVLLAILNVSTFITGTVKLSRGEYPEASIAMYWGLVGWFIWSCVHLLRFA